MTKRKSDQFIDAVTKSIEAQIIPALFSNEQRADMMRAHHSKYDHYHVSMVMTGDEPFNSQFFGVRPQLFIEDPAITRALIDAAPKTVAVTFKDKTYDVPLRLEHENYDIDARQWQADLERTRATRMSIDALQKGLKKKFNLSAGKDYSIGYGRGAKNTVHYNVQFHPRDSIVAKFNSKCADRVLASVVESYMSEELKTIAPAINAKVNVMAGRISVGGW